MRIWFCFNIFLHTNKSFKIFYFEYIYFVAYNFLFERKLKSFLKYSCSCCYGNNESVVVNSGYHENYLAFLSRIINYLYHFVTYHWYVQNSMKRQHPHSFRLFEFDKSFKLFQLENLKQRLLSQKMVQNKTIYYCYWKKMLSDYFPHILSIADDFVVISIDKF